MSAEWNWKRNWEKKLAAVLLCIAGLMLFALPLRSSLYAKAMQNRILSAPGTVEVSKLSYNSVTLKWSGVAEAAGYRVEYTLNGTEYKTAGKTAADVMTYKCRQLLTGTSYTFRVCALDSGGRAGNYTSVTAQPYLKKTAFTHAVVSGQHTVALEWKAVSGADSYQLYRKTKTENTYKLAADTARTVYKDTNISMDETYCYRVRAVRKVDGKTVKAKYSKAVEVMVTIPSIQLQTCEAVDYRSIKLTWQQAEAADGYYIYRSTKENGTYKKIKTINKNGTTSYIDTGIVPGKEFYYKVCVFMQEPGLEAVTGIESAYLSAQTQADAPVLTSAGANVSGRSIQLAWEAAEGAAGYRVYRSMYSNKKFVKIAELSGSTENDYEDRGTVPGETYYYRIKALYQSKTYKGLSGASRVLQAHAAPSAPIGLTIRQTATDVLEISWQKSAGAKSYNVYRADAGAAVYTCIAEKVKTEHYTDTGLKDDKTYFYRVSASGEAGEGLKCMPISCLVGGVSMNTRTLKLCAGASRHLEVSSFRKGRTVWKSSNSQIAEVDSNGTVTGIAYGTAEVTATIAGKSASVSVTVTPGSKNGIDVSRWQEDVDWCRVKASGIEFAFLRISNHYQEDYTFETKYQNASSVEMPLGVYCYSRAATVAEAQQEARTVLEILDGRELAYPVALNIEDSVYQADGMTIDTLHEMILAFKQIVEDAGYRFVLYSYVSFINSNLDKTKLDGIDLWLARYRSLLLGPGYDGTGNLKYWQYNSGQYEGSDYHVDGITDAAGNLAAADVNIEY